MADAPHPPPPPATLPVSDDDVSNSAPAKGEAEASAQPLMLVLEPRSLLLLTGAAYADWRHEILHSTTDDFGSLRQGEGGRCANATLLGGARMRELVRPDVRAPEAEGKRETREEGVVKREKRLSVTLRAVERVVKGLSLGGAGRRP